jgi:hypothetical protein
MPPTETAEFQRGAEAMRAACIAIVEPLGTYSDTVEMQTVLRIRSELERLIRTIDLEFLKRQSETDHNETSPCVNVQPR